MGRVISEPAGKQQAQGGKKAFLLGSPPKDDATRLYKTTNQALKGVGREWANRLPLRAGLAP